MQGRQVPLGAIEKDDGSVVVPESTRADGSKRKEIRIRKGFVPQDEQPLYRPRALRKNVEDITQALDQVSLKEKGEKEDKIDEEEKRGGRLEEGKRRVPLGAVETKDGDVIIPTSTRADGSVRKEIRVRKGYVPQEEQPLYRPRGRRQQDDIVIDEKFDAKRLDKEGKMKYKKQENKVQDCIKLEDKMIQEVMMKDNIKLKDKTI
ncbi:hypothetical protein THRCLA_00496 [Thraustotheca clavata]|uniref:WIBG Mago-binding domain-containing protein n=1 Tax=Thraustotheca clavata TaxID=74557 RepID=A0A1W0ABB8_9STRA|nr:hypothetical protein THRCLA_00496 [Thraustotheca clavata]